MNRPGLWVALAALVFVSAYLGYRLYHYQQDELARSSPEQPAMASEVLGRHRPEFTLPDLDGQALDQ